ncbi:hypothetical protein Ciccas_014292 [Cichlidogyrus casuarinus]|uniref:Uncharacterized protein n=1 Tax=Cichlidogyrus casuarinus TaxID=1844966 RepID=A0ABD2PIJ2_9PLAT
MPALRRNMLREALVIDVTKSNSRGWNRDPSGKSPRSPISVRSASFLLHSLRPAIVMLCSSTLTQILISKLSTRYVDKNIFFIVEIDPHCTAVKSDS